MHGSAAGGKENDAGAREGHGGKARKEVKKKKCISKRGRARVAVVIAHGVATSATGGIRGTSVTYGASS